MKITITLDGETVNAFEEIFDRVREVSPDITREMVASKLLDIGIDREVRDCTE